MEKLIALAQKAAALGEVPIAAAVIDESGAIITMAHNEVEMRKDATAHAELLALQAAMKRGRPAPREEQLSRWFQQWMAGGIFRAVTLD